jgi:uncharacterized protein
MSEEKLDSLIGILKEMESVLIACSGGLDSTFLLKAAALSGVKALAVTSRSETTPPRDLEDALAMAREIGVEHRVIETSEMGNENFVSNPPDRCFYCKDILFGRLRELADKEGLGYVVDGTTVDDLGDYRPGRRAADKYGVRSPLLEAGFTKDEIREASRELGLPLWDKPASPCLSSRIPYGKTITSEALKRVARAEESLSTLGFREMRVRDHGGIARVEVPQAELRKAVEMRERIVDSLRELGYTFVCLDLEGLKSGSLNRLIL